MKKILCILGVIALLAGLFAGCGKLPEPPADDGEVVTTAAEDAPVIADETPDITDAPEEDAPPVNDDDDDLDIGGEDDLSLGEALDELADALSIFSAGWPDNEFTKQVPNPKFETTLGGVSSETEFVTLCSASIDELKAYVKDLKAAGFTKSADTTDTSAFGITVYNYTASNSKGYKVEVNSAIGINSITISK